MDGNKYIIVEECGIELAIIFHHILTHADVARAYGRDNVIAAGFFYASDVGEVKVYGESWSLGGVVSRPEDAKIISKSIWGI